jgi:hypothetical protein
MDQISFEARLHWVMEHIQELEVQDFFDFVCNNREEFQTLTRASEKPSGKGWTEPNAQIMASPFGQRISVWVNSLPVEIIRPDEAAISPDPLPEAPTAPKLPPATEALPVIAEPERNFPAPIKPAGPAIPKPPAPIVPSPNNPDILDDGSRRWLY